MQRLSKYIEEMDTQQGDAFATFILMVWHVGLLVAVIVYDYYYAL